MQRRRTNRRGPASTGHGVFAVAVAATLGMAVLASCGGRTIGIPAAGAIPIPTMQTLPDDLARSPQLAALVPRDTAGLEVEEAGADTDLFPAALAALRALPDAPTKLSRISIDDDSVYFTYEQGGISGRSVSFVYRSADDVTISDPRFDDTATYPIPGIDAAVPAALVAAIDRRVPNGKVTGLDLEVGLSYSYGLVWHIDVHDARGSFATVFADLDGAIVGVDLA